MATAVASSIAYFVAWSLLASPFGAFPGDDGYVASNIIQIGGSMQDRWSALTYPNPVYYTLVYSVFKFCGVFVSSADACDPGEVILHIAIASNAVSVFLLGLLVFRLTGNLFAQFVAHALFAFAAWPVTYHFMISYTVTTTALVLLAFYLVIGPVRVSCLRYLLGGIATALVAWSSSSGPLTAALLIMAVVFLSWGGTRWRELIIPSNYDLQRLALFFVGFLVCVTFFGYFGLTQYFEHLLRNTNSDHYADALRRLGFVPQSPFFSYLHILGVYGRVGLLVFMSTLVAIPFLVANKFPAKRDTHVVYPVVVLSMFVVIHALLIDFLPSTKLARAHFPVYPVSLALICIADFLIYRWIAETYGATRALRMLLSVAFIAMIYEGAHQSMETRRVRTSTSEYLNELRGKTKLYVLRNDSHELEMRFSFDWQLYRLDPPTVSAQGRRQVNMTPRIGSWDRLIHVIEARDFSPMLVKPHQDSIVLLLGPYGYGSGLSLANKSDFYPGEFLDFKLLDRLIKETKVLPYHMHYPPFLLEEEINQALYFLGKTPDYRLPSMGITLLRF